MKRYLLVLTAVFMFTVAGCAPAIIGAGAAGAYKVGTDERTVGGMWNDATITTKVKTALIQTPDVKARHIDVDTLERIVTLTGVVDTQREAERAVEIARKIHGVKSVKSYLQVGTKTIGESMDDTILGTRIKSRLAGEPMIRSLNIDVDVNKGVVTLTGIVETGSERDRIIEIARETPGTVKVMDNIKVRKP